MSRVSVGWVSGACAAVAMVAAVAPVMRAQAPVPAAAAASAASADLARGAYLVEEVAQCGRCHSPVDSAGERDQTRWLVGGALDVAPTVAKENWAMIAPRKSAGHRRAVHHADDDRHLSQWAAHEASYAPVPHGADRRRSRAGLSEVARWPRAQAAVVGRRRLFSRRAV